MRHFTPEEANAALVEVRPLVEQMVEQRGLHVAALERQEELEGHIRGNGGGIPPAELATLEHEVNEAATELAAAMGDVQAVGVLIKDLDSGLVDFPAKRDGEDILLCWQLGEDEVAFWHGLEDGFAGRQPL